MPEPKKLARTNWLNVAILVGIASFGVAVWVLALIGAAWLLGLLP
jgi:hypothetical protein